MADSDDDYNDPSTQVWLHCPICDAPKSMRCIREKHKIPNIVLTKLEFVSKNEYTHDVAWPLHVEARLPGREKARWTLTFLNECTQLKLVHPKSLDHASNSLAFIAHLPAIDDSTPCFKVAEVRAGSASGIIRTMRPPPPLSGDDVSDSDSE